MSVGAKSALQGEESGGGGGELGEGRCHTWLGSCFPPGGVPAQYSNTGSHKMIAGARGTYSGSAQLRM